MEVILTSKEADELKHEYGLDPGDLTNQQKWWLKQYGVLGMKWGVRRSEAQLASAAKRKGRKRVASSDSTGSSSGGSGGSSGGTSSSGKARLDSGSGNSRSAQLEKARLMDDQTLRQSINRLQMEKQYADLTTPSKQTNQGAKVVTKFLGDVAKRQTMRQVDQRLSPAIDKGIQSAVNYALKKK